MTDILTDLQADLVAARAEAARLREALNGLLEYYVDMVASGDCGFWDPEKQQVVINARAALVEPSGVIS